MQKIKLLSIILLVISGVSCQSSIDRFIKDDAGADTYSSLEKGKVSEVFEGIVLNIKKVKISGSKGLGAGLGGALAAGIASNQYNSQNGKNNAAILGGLLGALGGSKLEEKLTEELGYEFLIKLNTGKIKSFVQTKSQNLRVGDGVYVIYNGDIARLTKK